MSRQEKELIESGIIDVKKLTSLHEDAKISSKIKKIINKVKENLK